MSLQITLRFSPILAGDVGVDYLPERVRIVPGTPADYARLARFHYRGGPPVTWDRVATAVYGRSSRVVGVAVLSWPALRLVGREAVFGRTRAGLLNRRLRTVSRVVVDPRFRGMNLGSLLVARLVLGCPTPYVETSAVMGGVHPLFTDAGFVRGPVGSYFWRATPAVEGRDFARPGRRRTRPKSTRAAPPTGPARTADDCHEAP